MDIEMPIMDGIELTRRLKADPATKHIVVVAFTAYARKGDTPDLQAAGFDGYIAKPVDVMTLGAEVRFGLISRKLVLVSSSALSALRESHQVARDTLNIC